MEKLLLLLELENYEQASKHLDSLDITTENISDELMELAFATYYEQSKLAEAAKFFSKCRKVMPEYSVAIYLDALTAYYLGKFTKAEIDLQLILTQDSEHLASVFLLLGIYISRQDIAKAEQLLTEYRGFFPENLGLLFFDCLIQKSLNPAKYELLIVKLESELPTMAKIVKDETYQKAINAFAFGVV